MNSEQSKPSIKPWLAIREYFAQLHTLIGSGHLLRAASLMVACALLEGAGLAMLAPVLSWLSGVRPVMLQWPASSGQPPPLPLTLLVFVAVIGLRALVIRARDIESLRVRLKFVDRLRMDLHAAIANAPWRFSGQLIHADVLQLLLADLNRVNQGTYVLLQGTASLAVGLSAFAVAMLLAPTLTLIAAATALVLSTLMRRRMSDSLSLGTKLSGAQRHYLASAAGFLGGLKLIKACGTEAQHMRAFANQVDTLAKTQLAFARRQADLRAWFEIGAGLALAILLYGGSALLRLRMTELLVVVLIFARLLPKAKEWNSQLQQLLHMLPAFYSVRLLLKRCSRVAEPRFNPAEPLPSLTKALEAKSVSYRHAHRPYAIREASFSLPAYQTTAVVGPSGAGKTTLADLVLGLLPPCSGSISVDGRVLDRSNAAAWRRTVAYVPQDAVLFPGTVRDNLLAFVDSADDAMLWTALRQAAADDFIRALPQGLDTLVGGRAASLSGGERQRLALARALLRQPQLLVLDEATSHLDAGNEHRIQAALEALHGQVTLLVIAHRLPTVRAADQILVLDKGLLVQRGTWDTLSSQAGAFQTLLHPADP